MKSSGPGVVAIIGAATGIFGVLWTAWRGLRERERLFVTSYVFHEESPSHRGPVAMIDVVNLGANPSHLTSAGVVDDLPWPRRWPVRLLSFRTRHRWLLKWTLGRSRVWEMKVPDFESTILGPRQLFQVRIDRPVAQIEQWASERPWVVVDSAIRPYVARLTDNRSTGHSGDTKPPT